MQPEERRIIILDEIPGQDESDASTSTKGRRTNKSSISQLPKGSAGRTRQQASARPATSLTCPSEPQDPGQGGHESTTSAVDTSWANSGGGSNANSGGRLSSASGAVDLEPPPAERTSTGVTTGFEGPAAPPARGGHESATSAVDTLQAYSRGSNAISGGGSNANSGGQSRNASRAVDLEPPPAERTSTGVTTGFGGPAVEGSSDTIAPVGRQSSTRASNGSDTRLAIGRDPNANSGGDSNVNSGGESSAVDTQQAVGRDPNAISGGDSNANSGGGSDVVDSQQAISRDSNANSSGQSAANTSVPTLLEVLDPPARKASRRDVVYDKYIRDAFIAIVSCKSAADRNRDCQRPTSRTRMCTLSLSISISRFEPKPYIDGWRLILMKTLSIIHHHHHHHHQW